jgi:hypothetical protein
MRDRDAAPEIAADDHKRTIASVFERRQFHKYTFSTVMSGLGSGAPRGVALQSS